MAKNSKLSPEISAKITSLENDYKRALADYQNLQKRHDTDRLAFTKYASSDLLEKLLPTLDDLSRAQEHLNDPGLKIVIDQLDKTLTNEGLTKINTTDTLFDPLLMDCIEVVPGIKDQVVTTLSPGYLYHDRVLRPARVTVGDGSTK